MRPLMLIVGGSRFVGRAFSELVIGHDRFDICILSRGKTNPEIFANVERLLADRNDDKACREVLRGRSFDCIVDFSCESPVQLENVILNCRCNHYTFLSDSAVDLSWTGDEQFSLAQSKLWCENMVRSACEKSLVVRPGFIVGRYDWTERFERVGYDWVWKGTKDPVRPLVLVDFLVSTMSELISMGHTGLFRAGYSESRIRMNANFPVLSERG